MKICPEKFVTPHAQGLKNHAKNCHGSMYGRKAAFYSSVFVDAQSQYRQAMARAFPLPDMDRHQGYRRRKLGRKGPLRFLKIYSSALPRKRYRRRKLKIELPIAKALAFLKADFLHTLSDAKALAFLKAD